MPSILKVNGKWIHDPQTLEYQRYDLDREEGSGRDQNGDMFRDRATTKIKLVCTFPPMTDIEMAALLQAVSPVFIEVEYPDAYTGTRKTMTAYVGDRSAPMYYKDRTGKWRYQAMSMNFIER